MLKQSSYVKPEVKDFSRPWMRTALLLVSDISALVFSTVLCVGVRGVLDSKFSYGLYWNLWPMIALFAFACAAAGLYNVFLSPPQMLKRSTLAVSFVFLTLGAVTFIFRNANLYSRAIYLASWILTMLLLPLFRQFVKKLLGAKSGWKSPAVLLGAGETGRRILHNLNRHHEMGLKPVAFLDDSLKPGGKTVDGLPVLGGRDTAPYVLDEYPGAWIIICDPTLSQEELDEIMDAINPAFTRVITMHDILDNLCIYGTAIDTVGIPKLEASRKLFDARRRKVKRTVDLICGSVACLFLLPLFVLISLLIKLESKGPIIFKHERIGAGGEPFMVYKFRTMVQDADKLLKRYLEEHPELKEEWEKDHKLRHEPRLTRLGRILRVLSLDEMPQFINILKGEMSLVGPRPIVRDEIAKIEDWYQLYKQVPPGLTGLWQVSGRNDTSYAERARLNAYYIRNWSVWLDLYIMLKTPAAVLSCRGAC